MTVSNITPAPLVYNGEIIHQRDEMLSLTDMWKAAGSAPSRTPNDWLRTGDAERFVEFLASTLNIPEPGHNRFGLVKVVKGGVERGSTHAHWQIALAYAKYLSPEFHMWCNSVVRERMTGKSVSATSLPADVLEQIRRTDGISRMLSHKSVEIDKALAETREANIRLMAMMAALANIVQPQQPILVRRGKTAGQIWRDNKLQPLKNAASWFGNKLAKAGCRIVDNGCAEMGLTKARLFDPDKAQQWLDELGGRSVVDRKIAERRGQGKLNLTIVTGDRPNA